MMPLVQALVVFVVSVFRSRIALQLEVVALRQQLNGYRRSRRRPRVRPGDRIFWASFARHWARWREVLVFVHPATVIGWQHRRFREHWAWLQGQRFECSALERTYQEYRGAVEQLVARVADLDRAIAAVAVTEPYRQPVGWLRCFRGVDTLAAMTLSVVNWPHGSSAHTIEFFVKDSQAAQHPEQPAKEHQGDRHPQNYR